MSVLDKILEEIEEKYRNVDREQYDCSELSDVEDWYDAGDIHGQLVAYDKCMDIVEAHVDRSSVLEQILEEIENEAMTNKEIGRKQCEGMARAMNIIRSHMDDSSSSEKCSENNHAFVVKNVTAEQFKELTKNQNSFKKEMERFNRNKGCMVYEVDSNAMEDVKPVSIEFLEECAEVARKYKKNTEDNKCSDCSRRKWYQIGYRDGKNEMKNDGWIPVEERLPKKPVFGEDSYIVQHKCITTPYSAYWDGENWTENYSDEPIRGIIAWQPLPKQYKPKKQD